MKMEIARIGSLEKKILKRKIKNRIQKVKARKMKIKKLEKKLQKLINMILFPLENYQKGQSTFIKIILKRLTTELFII